MSDIVSAEAAAQEGEALLPSAELAKNLGLTLAASVVLTFSTIVYMQGGLHSYFYAQSAWLGREVQQQGDQHGLSPRATRRVNTRLRGVNAPRAAEERAPHSWTGTLGVGVKKL